MALNKFYPYLAFGMASHFRGYETEYMTLLFKDMEPNYVYGLLMKKPLAICIKCKYPTDSKNYASFILWAKQDLFTTTSKSPCYRCEAPKEYRDYVKECVKEKSDRLQNLTDEQYYTCRITTHIAEAGTDYISESFDSILPTLDMYEFMELVQYMCIFPTSAIPKHYTEMVKAMRQYCKKFGLTQYNVFKKKYDRWWAKEFRNQIENNIPLVREILFPEAKQIVGVRTHTKMCGCGKYFHIKMTSEKSKHKDNDVIEKEEPVEDKTFEEFYNDHPEYKGYISV